MEGSFLSGVEHPDMSLKSDTSVTLPQKDPSGSSTEQRKQKLKFFESLVHRASSEMLKKLISNGAELNCKTSDGLTPLMLALCKVDRHYITDTSPSATCRSNNGE